MDIKYYTKKTIVKCNRESIRKNRNRNFKPEDLNQILSKVPDDWKFPIVMEFPHNDIEMRTFFHIEEPKDNNPLSLDISWQNYEGLPIYKHIVHWM